jgi:non-specific serine/threonine protein kinase
MPERLQPGRVIDGFRLEERLHVGGMAAIWRVTHPGHDPLPMIMKVPLVEYGEGPGNIVGFEVEQMILPRLMGPHVPRFVAAAGFEEQPYLVMERLPGPSLVARVAETPLDAGAVADLGARVARALDALHRQHVIHLDLKPSNVMLRETGEAVLVDFGLSRHDRLPDLLAEEIPLPHGTAPYIAPEQVLGHRSDPRSDLFALGVMLYFLATGRRPFGQPSGRRALRRRLYRDPVPPRALNPAIPHALQEVILRCLEVDPERRHPTAALLAFDLAHPGEVALTGRAHRMHRDPLGVVLRRWFGFHGAAPRAEAPVARRLAEAPIIMAAVDLAPGSEELADHLRGIVRRILQLEPKARLACVSVLKVPRIGVDFGEDAQGRNLHVRRLVELRHWARPLAVPDERFTCTVLEAPDPAPALIEFARNARVDHIVIGARGASAVRRYLGSVSSQVVAEAPCNVTVVRVRGPGEAPWNGGEGPAASSPAEGGLPAGPEGDPARG